MSSLSAISRVISACRVCNSKKLAPVFSLGDLYISDFLDDSERTFAKKAPLELVLCNESDGGCGLLQLMHTVSNEAMYRQYWYLSGTNATMVNELNGISRKVESMADLKEGDFVMDIGANDGTLLRGYTTKGIHRTGFEPARNLEEYNSVGTSKIISDFFSFSAWHKEFANAKAKVITAIAMFYDLDDPNAFVADVKRCLHDEGVFIIQQSYLPLMLSQNDFGNICHEHLEYYSLFSLENLLKRHNLEIFDVELNDINGGSFRTYIWHIGKGETMRVSPSAAARVQNLRESEAKLNLGARRVYDDFVERVNVVKDNVVHFIKEEVEKGKKIYVYGASTKGNTILQYFNLDTTLITAAVERNPAKWGKKTVGTNIPIISEEQARKEHPDYFLVLPWHFLKEFKEREAEYLQSGGKFIVPLPEFTIVEA